LRIAQSAGDTNTGRKRRRNEDNFVRKPPLFAVADGMGGAQAGEVASSLAAAALEESATGPEGGEEHVVELIQEANRRVHERATHDAAASGMGTTITVALVGNDGCVTIGHVGDSRAYVLRDGELEQLTEDHSLVAGLVRMGTITPAEAEDHPQRSVILRAVGVERHVEVDVDEHETASGDVYLLCSDGLSGMVRDEVIEATLALDAPLDAIAGMLIELANASGGRDNITAVLFRV
jgi:serine/threonine protein phosphatase PrpC